MIQCSDKTKDNNLEKSPRHIAIIMDGNGRWAKQRHLPRIAGHKAGVETVRRIVKRCLEKQIDVLTLFAFGVENWQRPATEVNYLMKLLFTALKTEVAKLHKQNIQLQIIGDRTRLNKELSAQIEHAEQLTADNSGLKLVIAVNYSGRWDISEGIRKIVKDIEQKKIVNENLTPELIHTYFSLADLPEPDLLIRTSGEQRISNFMLWQFAYTELYFTNIFWPDFTENDFDKALDFFKDRERRFGVTSEQVRAKTHAHLA